MTEMMDLTSDLVGTGIPFLDYKSYAERIFFPGHRESPLQRDLDIPECRRQTVEQGLVQLSNLLNSKLFLTKVRSLFLLAECIGVWAVLLAGRGQCSLKFLPEQLPLQHHCLQEPLGGTALFSGGSRTALSLSPPVHPHSGNPAYFLSERPGLCGISAHRVAAWEAGVLH